MARATSRRIIQRGPHGLCVLLQGCLACGKTYGQPLGEMGYTAWKPSWNWFNLLFHDRNDMMYVFEADVVNCRVIRDWRRVEGPEW